MLYGRGACYKGAGRGYDRNQACSDERRGVLAAARSAYLGGGIERKARDGRGYVLLEDGVLAALMRYNLFWDNTPFCTLLYVDECCRGRGHGGALMRRWEADMKVQGYGLLMTSTLADETAQHFYRKLGDRGCGRPAARCAGL